jgi:hypothetical protein
MVMPGVVGASGLPITANQVGLVNSIPTTLLRPLIFLSKARSL